MQISDTELVNSNTSSRTGSSTECLKAPTRAKCYYLEQKHPMTCLIDFHEANIEILLCTLIL